MKNALLVLTFAALLSPGLAQQITVGPTAAATVVTQAADPFIKGTMNITYDTVAHQTAAGKVQPGFLDHYQFNVNISNSARFQGTIDRQPFVPVTFGANQPGLLTYAVDADIINPKNPKQQLNVGRLYGTVPNDKYNVYRFADGTLKMSIEGRGSAAGFESSFGGLALGKPPATGGLFSSMKAGVISITRSVKGQSMTIKVEKYDKMEFQSHILASGPVQTYPAVTINGTMIYDYGRNAWHFQNVSAVYALKGQQYQDILSGDIQWKEDENRKSNGQGEYDFDIRVNEPPPSEDAAFTAASASDESSFFATDDSVPSLVGTMKYTDTIQDGSITADNPDGNVTASAIAIDLKGNKLNKQQVMYLAKLLLFSVTVPLNSN